MSQSQSTPSAVEGRTSIDIDAEIVAGIEAEEMSATSAPGTHEAIEALMSLAETKPDIDLDEEETPHGGPAIDDQEGLDGLKWHDEPEYLVAIAEQSDDLPTEYAEKPWVNPNNAEDTTSFKPGQAKWGTTQATVPKILFRHAPTKSFIKGLTEKAEQKRDAAGMPLREKVAEPDKDGNPRSRRWILDFPILPDCIGTDEEPFRFEAWRRLDPRIGWSDIHMRMTCPRPTINSMNMEAGRWRKENLLATWRAKGKTAMENKNKVDIESQIPDRMLQSNNTADLVRTKWLKTRYKTRKSAKSKQAADASTAKNKGRGKGKGKRALDDSDSEEAIDSRGTGEGAGEVTRKRARSDNPPSLPLGRYRVLAPKPFGNPSSVNHITRRSNSAHSHQPHSNGDSMSVNDDSTMTNLDRRPTGENTQDADTSTEGGEGGYTCSECGHHGRRLASRGGDAPPSERTDGLDHDEDAGNGSNNSNGTTLTTTVDAGDSSGANTAGASGDDDAPSSRAVADYNEISKSLNRNLESSYLSRYAPR